MVVFGSLYTSSGFARVELKRAGMGSPLAAVNCWEGRCSGLSRLLAKMGVSGDEAVTEGNGFRLGRKILEVVRAAGAKMAENAPEMRILRLALLDDMVVEAVRADTHAGMDFQGIEIPNVLHPARREHLCGVNG